MSLLSVVMPVWSLTAEMRDMAEETLDSLFNNQKGNVEYIIIDNGSLYKGAEWSPRIENNNNRGFTQAINQGLIAARGDYVCIANSDLLDISRGWDSRLWELLYNDNAIAFPCPDTAANLDWFPPGFMFMAHRETFARIGAFDERFFLFYSDSDYWVRARELGIPLIADASLKIKNRRRVTVDAGEKAGKLDPMQFTKDEAKFIHKYGGRNPLDEFKESGYFQVVNG